MNGQETGNAWETAKSGQAGTRGEKQLRKCAAEGGFVSKNSVFLSPDTTTSNERKEKT